MARVRKRQEWAMPLLPITGDEVAAMFRRATKVPPYPDAQSCELIAAFLTGHTGKSVYGRFARSTGGKRLRESIVTVLGALDSDLIRDDYEKTSAALRSLLVHPWVELHLKFPKAPEWIGIAPVVWSVTEGALTELGRHAGLSKASVAVEFTALALERMGYGRVNRATLAAWLAELFADDRAAGKI